MDSRSLKVFIACFLGGGIGTLIASSLAPYLWWIGLLAGMFIGYTSYEFEKVLKAIPEAFMSAFSWISEVEFAKKWEQIIYFVLLSSFVFEPLALLFLFGTKGKFDFDIIMLVFILAVAVPGLLGFCAEKGSIVYKMCTRENALTYNFFAFYFYLIPMCIIKDILCIPTFLKTLFIMIHSDERLLCMVDAGIGCCIGHYCGNIAIIGAISGGLAGLLHYELISKRILKLIPIEATPKQED